MKRYILALFTAGIFLALIVADLPWNMGAHPAGACGYGEGGGQGYVPGAAMKALLMPPDRP